MEIVIIGLTITSSWGNGHATTYRALVRELVARGHSITFLERDVPYYASQRDFRGLPGTNVILYTSLDELKGEHQSLISQADAVMLGSYVPQGIEVGEWMIKNASGAKIYYDIDTPVTLARMARNDCEYLSPELIPNFDLFLSFTGGKTLRRLEEEFGSPRARAFYCSVDPSLYFPETLPQKWTLGYLGTYSDDRQPGLERLLCDPARALSEERFVVAGPQYPETVNWPENVQRIDHLPPDQHRIFYNSQRFTLNITRADMIEAGHSPSVRLFEAAACGTPIISDYWEGLDELFEFGTEILVAPSTEEAIRLLRELSPEMAVEIGAAGRRRILAGHTAAHRALELENHIAALKHELESV